MYHTLSESYSGTEIQIQCSDLDVVTKFSVFLCSCVCDSELVPLLRNQILKVFELFSVCFADNKFKLCRCDCKRDGCGFNPHSGSEMFIVFKIQKLFAYFYMHACMFLIIFRFNLSVYVYIYDKSLLGRSIHL